MVARGRRTLTNVAKSILRRRVLVPTFILLLLVATYPATLWLHSLLVKSGSTDAWAAAIGTVATVELVLVTAWYAYLTFSLLEAQRAAPRAASWESALREVMRYMVGSQWTVMPTLLSAPVDMSKQPDGKEIVERAGVLTDAGIELTKLAVHLPNAFMLEVGVLSAALMAASNEQLALARTIVKAIKGAEGNPVTWDEVRRFHEQGSDSDSWNDMIEGRAIEAAKARWNEFLRELARELTN
jgi:hypothetical protein